MRIRSLVLVTLLLVTLAACGDTLASAPNAAVRPPPTATATATTPPLPTIMRPAPTTDYRATLAAFPTRVPPNVPTATPAPMPRATVTLVPYRGLTQVPGSACPPARPVKGNEYSGIYHQPGQQYYESTNGRHCFTTPQEAANAGYRPSRV